MITFRFKVLVRIFGRWLGRTQVLLIAALSFVAISDSHLRRAHAGDDPRPAKVAEQVRDSLRRAHLAGAGVAVYDHFEVVWTEGFGLANVDQQQPVTPETRFQAASISKPVSALAALLLVSEGKLNLDAPVNDFLKSWKIPENDFTRQTPVTLRQILCHGAGLTVSGFPGYAQDAPRPELLQILEGQPPCNSPPIVVDQPPGEKFRYAGGGYIVLQQLIEDVTGRSFTEYLAERVLAPLDMQQSAFEQPPRGEAALYASGHRPNGSVVPGRWHIYPELAAGGLWTTPRDLARFGIEISRALTDQEPRVAGSEMVGAMVTPQVAPHMGLGFFLRGSGEAARFLHTGGNEGFNCILVGTQRTGQGVVIMTNQSGGMLICDALVRQVAELYDWPQLGPGE